MYKLITKYSRHIIHIIDTQYTFLSKYDKIYGKSNKESGNKPIVLIHSSWHCSNDKIRAIINFSDEYEYVILASSEEEQSQYKKNFKQDVLLMGHNVFLNEKLILLKENTIRDYDMLVNSGIDSYKKIHLAHLVNSVAYISRMGTNICNRSNILFSKNSIFPNFKDNLINLENYHRLNHEELSNLSARCLAGGIFSNLEGSCFSSSEYLLCGLPVISTKCKGGREIWYNSDNSIYCEDTPESVAECMEIVKQKLKDGSFNRKKIRDDHINLQEKFRSNLTNYIITKLKDNGDKDIDFNLLKKQLSVLNERLWF